MIFGFLMFILISFPLLGGNLDYKSGEIINLIQDNSSEICKYELSNISTYYTYGKNYTSYHWDYESPTTPPYTEVNLFHNYDMYNYDLICNNATKEIKEYSYTNYNDTLWYGLFLLFAGVVGEFYIYSFRRKKEDED